MRGITISPFGLVVTTMRPERGRKIGHEGTRLQRG